MATSPGAPADALFPDDIRSTLAAWYRLWRQSAGMHYGLGIGGIVFSGMATQWPNRPTLPFLTGLCTALIAFGNPERRYLKFVRAWRVLNTASMRYRAGLITREQLIDAEERGQSLIESFEADFKPGA